MPFVQKWEDFFQIGKDIANIAQNGYIAAP